MHMLTRLLAILFLAVLFAPDARADDPGENGTIAGLEIVNDSADLFLQFHGRLFVRNDSKTIDEYRWGGTSCGTRILEESQVAALQRGFDNKKAKIAPSYQLGQGAARCLVAFTIASKSFAKDILP